MRTIATLGSIVALAVGSTAGGGDGARGGSLPRTGTSALLAPAGAGLAALGAVLRRFLLRGAG